MKGMSAPPVVLYTANLAIYLSVTSLYPVTQYASPRVELKSVSLVAGKTLVVRVPESSYRGC